MQGRGYRWLLPPGAALGAWVLAVAAPLGPFHDEWWYLCGRSLADPASLLAAHNDHWVTLHAAAYLALSGATGVEWPTLIALVIAHVAAVAALYRLTQNQLAAAVFLLFGAGYEALFWGFELGWVGAIALGLWALVAFREERPGRGALLLLAGVATQGTALFFVPAIAAFLVASRRPRDVAWLIGPVGAWTAWFVLERSATRLPFPDAAGAVSYAAVGAVGALGLGGGTGVGALNALLEVAARPRRVTPLTWAGTAGLVGMFAALALSRDGIALPDSSRYVYAAAPFVLLALASIEVRRPVFVQTALAIALVLNVVLLVTEGLAWPGYVAAARAAGSDSPPFVCPATPS